MSRWLFGGRCTVEQTLTIDIGMLRRAGYVGKPAPNGWKSRDKLYALGFWAKSWRDGHIELPHQVLQTEQVPWRFGGQRFYFRCECGRRVEKLHSARGEPWRCRHCYDLTYATRQAVPWYRHILKAQKIRERLGGSLRMLDDFPPKPNGMHRKRYERLRRCHDTAVEQALGMMADWIRRFDGGLRSH